MKGNFVVHPWGCRLPALNSADLSQTPSIDPGGGGVRERVRLLPLIQLQLFEQNGNTETIYSDKFYYKGISIDIPANEKSLVLKACFDLVWVDGNLVVTNIPVQDKIVHILNHIQNCGDANGIRVVVIQ